jgi:outer membrane protein assembly factor BamB
VRRLLAGLLIVLTCASCGRKSEKAVSGEDPGVAGAGASVERQAEAEATVEALTAKLVDPAPETKVAAADALGKMGAKAASAAPRLVATLEDPSAWARVSAMETLVAIGPPAVSALVDAIENGEGPIRVRSVLVLGSMAGDATAAIQVLEKIAEDESLPWRGLAAGALGQIAPDLYGGGAAGSAVKTPAVLPEPGEAVAKTSSGWPEFQGPHRDSRCRETGLLASWPDGGPKLLWRTEGLGHGYSTVAIVGEKIFTTGDFGEHGKGGRQCVVALNLADGKELWVSPIAPAGDDAAYGTPTVDGDLLYAVGTEGDLVCMETSAGQLKWRKNFARDFGGKIMSKWQFSESPLVDGQRLVCSPGAADAAIAALDKITGDVIWKAAEPNIGEAGKGGAGYASMIVAEIHGVRQYIQMTGRGVVSVDATTGAFLWGYNRIANGIANIPSPRVRGNYVFVTTGYRTGSALLEIKKDGDAFRAEEVYFLSAKEFENHHGGVVLAGDHVYGGSGTSKGVPVCIELATGKIAWRADAPQRGSAAVLYADGHVIYRYDRGLVVLVEATPEMFRIKGRLEPPRDKGPAWAHPVIHNKKLYLRHSNILMCYDISAP